MADDLAGPLDYPDKPINWGHLHACFPAVEKWLGTVPERLAVRLERGLPVALGTSRKSFIKHTMDKALSGGARDDLRERVAGTAATVVIGVLRGARIVRVHDVGLMSAVTRMTESVRRCGVSA